MKDKSFKPRFVALVLQTTAILQGKTSPNFARKEAFAYAKAMVIIMKKELLYQLFGLGVMIIIAVETVLWHLFYMA